MFGRLSPKFIQDHIQLYANAPQMIYLGHISSAAVLLYLAHDNPSVPVWWWYGWLVLECMLTPICMGGWVYAYQRAAPPAQACQRWVLGLDILFFCIGLSWGAMIYVSLQPDHPAHFAMQMAIAAGASAAAVKSLGIFPRTFVVYVVPFLGLLAMRIFQQGGDYTYLGLLVLVFAIMLVGLSADMRSQVADYIRIKMENLDLAEKYRKAATAAEKANRDKTRFLASASHDLRQPLHAMGLHLATLQQQAAAWPADAQQTITHIEGTLESATRLFNGVLDVSLLETGRLTVRQSVFALQPFLQGIQQDLAPLAQLAHMNIVIPPAGESLMVRSDAILLRRMIQNLMSNSIRHSGGTHVQIDTVALPQDAPQHVVLRVWDNGRGLPDRVWDDMAASSSASSASSASAAACRLTAGSHVVGATDNLGLGLAIVRQMADALGVDITPIPMVAPQPASGLCIEIGRLPVDHATVTAPDPAAGQCAPCHAQVTAPFPILVIENDAEARTGLVAVLRSWGYDPVAICGQADTRVHQVNPADFRVILCDVHLHDGVFAPVWLRDMWLGDIPVDKCPAVVVMSGMPVDAVPPDITAYAHVIMQKPVRPVQLRSVLLRYQSVAS